MAEKRLKVLVYGDIIEDRYTQCVSTRKCPEEVYAPVLDVVGSQFFDGCAGNVFQNMRALAASISSIRPDTLFDLEVAGICGPKFYSRHSWQYPGLVADDGITKERLILDGKIIARVDSKKLFSSIPPRPAAFEGRYDLAIISDYMFGAVDSEIAMSIIERSNISVVDSKRPDMAIFDGATVFKHNLHESTLHSAGKMMSLCDYYVVSKGEDGLSLIDSYRAEIYPVQGHRVDDPKDVTGCGDTLTSAIGLGLVMGANPLSACRFANYLASRVVQHMGPSFPNYEDVDTALRRYL